MVRLFRTEHRVDTDVDISSVAFWRQPFHLRDVAFGRLRAGEHRSCGLRPSDGIASANTFAKMLRADDYPIGMPADAAERFLRIWERAWGTGIVLELSAPSVADDPQMQRWTGRYMRLSAPPAESTRMYRWVLQLDVRSVLPSIHAPTLILHRVENRHYRAPMGRYLAEHIPGATYVELPGADWYPPFVNAEPVLDEIEEFLTGARPAPAQDRILATVLFTDIVRSTDLAARLGDQRWLDLKAAHDGLVRTHLDRYQGKGGRHDR